MTHPTPTPDVPPAPPLHWLVGYRLLGLRLPEPYRAWVARDVLQKHFLTWRMGRTAVWALSFVALARFAYSTIYQPPLSKTTMQFVLIAIAISLLGSGKTLVRRTLRWQHVDKYGRPVTPDGLAAMGTLPAVLLATAVLVTGTGLSALRAFDERPAVIECDSADDEVMDRLRAGLKNPETTLTEGKQVAYGVNKLVAVRASVPGQERDQYWLYLVEPDVIYELREAVSDALSPTSFDPLPRERADRALGPPLQNLGVCLNVVQTRS